jgi:hypothetical protein
MKRPITGVVALLAGVIVAYSQGTVSFGNYVQLQSYIYVYLGSARLSPPTLPPLSWGGQIR